MNSHFFVLLVLISLSAHMQAGVRTVAQIGDDMILSTEVEEYIDALVISPAAHMALMARAQEEKLDYEDEKRKLIEQVFVPALKRLVFIRLLQKDAVSRTERKYFTVTTEQMDRMVEDQISKVLSSFGKRGGDLVAAKTALIDGLKSSYIGSSLGTNDEVIYKNWLRKVRYQWRERYREQEAIKYLCTLGNCDRESPMEILSKHIKRLGNKHFIRYMPVEDRQTKGHAALDEIVQIELNLPRAGVSAERETLAASRRYLFLGRIVNERFELRHINDYDLTFGLAPRWGYPDTDDQGRTSGLIFSYAIQGDRGSLTFELENWLFSREVPTDIPGAEGQEVEEASTLRVVSRHFLDDSGSKWVIVGFSAGHRMQSAGVASWIQSTFHLLNPSNSERDNHNRDGRELFLQGLVGVGGKYSILEIPHVDLVISGEALLVPTLGMSSRNNITVSSNIDLNIWGRRREYPLFSPGLFMQYSFLANGSIESVLGGKIGLGKILGKVYYQANMFIAKWNTDLDHKYEGRSSWTTGIFLSATIIKRQKEVHFEFN